MMMAVGRIIGSTRRNEKHLVFHSDSTGCWFSTRVQKEAPFMGDKDEVTCAKLSQKIY